MLQDISITEGNIMDNIIYKLHDIGLNGLIIVLLLFMSLSTLNSIINVTSVICVNDILRVLNVSNRIKTIATARSIGLFITMIAILMVLMDFKIQPIEFLFCGYQYYIAGIVIPILLYIYNYRFTTQGIGIGIFLSLCFVAILQNSNITTNLGFIIIFFITPIIIYLCDYAITSYKLNMSNSTHEI